MSKPVKRQQLPAKYEPGFLREMDLRTGLAQRLHENFNAICDDAGGAADLAHTKLAMIERFVFLEAMLATMEQQIADGADNATELLGKWVQGINAMQGLAKLIGLERQARRADLKAYMAEREA